MLSNLRRFDALFFAPVGRIPQREIPKSHQRKRFFRFRQRTPQEVQASKYKLLKLLEQYGEKMMFRFHDGRMDAITGMEDDQSSFLCVRIFGSSTFPNLRASAIQGALHPLSLLKDKLLI